MNRFFIAVLAITVAGGCVKAHTVEQSRLGDDNLTCRQVADRIGEHRAIKALAQDKKGVSGENVASFLFFWPAIFGNVANANDTIESSERRISVLNELYESGDCAEQIPVYTQDEIKQMLEDGEVTDLQDLASAAD